MLAILIGLLAQATRAGEEASTITLRSTVLVAPGQPVTLGDIAVLAGEEADRLARTTIDVASLNADPAGWRKIDAQGVRDALEAASPLWGTVQLRGGPCYVRTLTHEPQASHETLSPPTPDRPAMPGTVRELAEQWIAGVFTSPVHDVEVRWVSSTDGLLDHTTVGLLPQIDDSGRSDRMSLRVTLFDPKANVVVEGEAKAEIRVRRDVAVLARDVRKRRTLDEGDFRVERQWTDATASPADPASLVGREAAANLKAGDIVKAMDVHSSVAIERGERVQIRIITPTVTARLLARAMADGRPGEIIEFESIAPSRSDRLRFKARVESAGSAVAVTGVQGQ
jgi:flagella basal body P-ring formation protein FlgA